MPFQKGNQDSVKGGQSRRGKPNKTTRDAREAIARFVDRNAGSLQRWLNAVSDGLREGVLRGPDGKVILDEEGNPLPGPWIVKPDPERAFVLFQSVIEYHVPKLSRREVVKADDKAGRILDSSQFTAEQREQLRQIILANAEPALLEQIAPNMVQPAGLAGSQVVDCIEQDRSTSEDEA